MVDNNAQIIGLNDAQKTDEDKVLLSYRQTRTEPSLASIATQTKTKENKGEQMKHAD